MRTMFSSRQGIALALLFATTVAFVGSTANIREPLASAETRFVEMSAGGMQIVPASCPSDPHYSGECSGQMPPPGEYCNIYVSPQTIVSGNSATLSWAINTDRNSGSEYAIIDPLSYESGGEADAYPASGSEEVSPTATTEYTLYAHNVLLDTYYNTYFGSCWRTLNVCPANQRVFDNTCVSACPVGYSADSEGQCIFLGCPVGYHLNGGLCIPDDEEGSQCAATYFCVGSDLYQRDTQCIETGPVQQCAFGCSGGGCLLPPEGTGDLTVQPSLIRSGERTTVSWTTSGMVEDSCAVTENNPDIIDVGDGENDSFQSSQIRQQTTYTLTCEKLEGGTFTDSATVNIIPVFQEN